MANFRPNTRLDVLMYLLERDGNRCSCGCGQEFTATDLPIIEHVDNNKRHNCPRNLRLFRRSCNAEKAHKQDAYAKASGEHDSSWLYSTWRQWGAKGTHRVAYQKMSSNPINDNHNTGTPMYVSESAGASERTGGRAVPDDASKRRSRINRTPTMIKNDECEAPFNKYVNELLIETEGTHVYYTYDDLALAGANLFGCSQETTKRYLDKRLNKINGDLREVLITGKIVIAFSSSYPT